MSFRSRLAGVLTPLPPPGIYEFPFEPFSLANLLSVSLLDTVSIEAASEAIDLEFPRVTSSDAHYEPLPESTISSNLLLESSLPPEEVPLPLFPEPMIEDRLEFLDSLSIEDFTGWLVLAFVVGEDWHEPLHIGEAPRGKVYQEQEPPDQEGGEPGVVEERPREGGRRNVRIIRVSRGRSRVESLSIWDLLLPILEPPPDAQTQQFIFWPGDLYPYQREGVRFLAEHEVALLGDDMGTGKTIQSVVALQLLVRQGQARSALVVCPSAVIRQWDRELEKWTTLRPAVVTGPPELRQLYWNHPAHVWIVSYETLRNDLQEGRLGQLNRFNVIIADEVHKIKNPSAQISQAIRGLQARYRWGLSGTPIQNRLEDLQAIFQFLQPGLLSSQRLTPEEARTHIAPYFLRRRIRDVVEELPPLLVNDVWLELEGRQLERYQEAEEQGVIRLREMDQVTVPNILQLITHLKQLCNFEPESGQSIKYDRLRDLVEERAANQDKLLIYSQFREQGVNKINRRLTAEGYRTILLCAQNSANERDRLVREFNQNSSYSAFLSTPQVGGVGLNIQAANYVVLFDHWWNPAVTQQAIGRAWRIGQIRDVFVYHFWTENTIEERIYDIVERKRQLYQEVIDSQSNVEGHGLSEEELFELFGLEHPARTEANRRLDELRPDEFEHLVGQLFERNGYNMQITGRSRDGGIDAIGIKRTGFGTERIAIQCKRWDQNRPVGPEVAREFLGSLTDNSSFTRGFLVTTSRFTRNCREFCTRHGIECWDRVRLLYLLREANLL